MRGLGRILSKLGGRRGARPSSRRPSSGGSGSRSRRRTRRDRFVEEFGEGFSGFARGFFSDLFSVDFSLGEQSPSLGIVGNAISGNARASMNMGRPAPEFNVTAKTARRFNNPTLQVISNQIADIIDSMSSINGQLQSQLDMTRYAYNDSLKVQRENILEAGGANGAGSILAANDNSPTSTLGTNTLIQAMVSVADELKGLTDKLKDVDFDSIAACCGGDDMDIDYYGGDGGDGGEDDDDTDTRKKRRRRGTRGRRFRGLRVRARMLARRAGRMARAVGRGALAMGAGALKYARGGLAGLAVGLGADFAADYFGRDTRAGAGFGVLSSTATYAGTGAMIGAGIGSVVPIVGTAAGAAVGAVVGAVGGLGVGLYDNWQALTSPARGFGENGSTQEAMRFFTSQGWSKEQAAGIVGNLQVESGPQLRTNVTGDGGRAYGIAQWHPDRQAQFMRVYGKPIQQSNFREQLQFIQWELRNSERAAGDRLLRARTAEEAAAIVDQFYERSSGAARGQRIANARTLAQSSTATDTPAARAATAATMANFFPTMVGRDPRTGAPSLLLAPEARRAMEASDRGQGWGGAPWAAGTGPQNFGLPLNERQVQNREQGRMAREAAAARAAPRPTDATARVAPPAPQMSAAAPSGDAAVRVDVQNRTGAVITAQSATNEALAAQPQIQVVPIEVPGTVPTLAGSAIPTAMVGTDGAPDPTYPDLLIAGSATRRAFYYADHRAYRRQRGVG